MSNNINVAIIGADSEVGEAARAILRQRKFPLAKLYEVCDELANFDFAQAEMALFFVADDVAKQYIPQAVDAGCVVIDSSRAFVDDYEVPLIIPEVNRDSIENYRERNIITNPSSTTIQLAVALKPIYDAVGIRSINVTTYQAVTGVGREGVTELAEQTALVLNGQEVTPHKFNQRIAFNVLPQVGEIEESGSTTAESQVVAELARVFVGSGLTVSCTAVYVPIFYGDSAAVHIETERELGAEEAAALLNQAPGVMVQEVPTPLTDSLKQDAVYVGRIRKDLTNHLGLNLWTTVDNIRKGTALNAVQILELLYA